MSAPNPSRTVGAALSLHFFAVAAIVLCRTYIDQLFLVTYPRSWLPWFFLGQTGVALALTFILGPLVSRGSAAINAGMVLAFATSAVGARWLVPLSLPGLPFAICLWLSGCAIILGVLAWSAVGDAFDVRQFKRIAKWINAAGSVGAAVFGSAIPLLIAALPADGLLFVLGGAMVLAATCLGALSQPAERAGAGRGRAAESARSPFGYPLFTQLALGAGMLMLVDTFADYAIKVELAAAYDKDGIGQFMGPFYGISSVATLVSQLGTTDWLARSFGVIGLLAPLPTFCLVAGGALAARPGLWTAAALRMGQNIARYGVDNLGREIAARPLPAPIRRAGKLYLKGLATPVGAGVAAIGLWVAAERVGLRGVGVGIVVCCAAWLLVTRRTTRSYQGALEDAIGAGRLSVSIDEVSPEALHQARAVARHALASKDPESIRFGLQLLDAAGEGALPAEVSRQLDADDPAVRTAAAVAARSFEAGVTVPALLARLEIEQVSTVRGALLESLAGLDPESAVSAAEALLHGPRADEAPAVRAGALIILLSAGDLDSLVVAVHTLQAMLGSDDPAQRKGAARAIGGLKAGRLERELRALIGDADPEVQLAGVRAVAARRTHALAGELVGLLDGGPVAREAGKALTALGESAVPVLVEAVVEDRAVRTVRAALRALAAIPGAVAERALVGLVPRVERTSTRCLLAREVALRARLLPPADSTRKLARAEVHVEARRARALAGAALSVQLPPRLGSELRAHRNLALSRMLHWMAVCTKPAEVIETAPVVVGAGGTSPAKRAAALELLDSLADRDLRGALAVIEEKPREPADARAALRALGDPWVDWLLDRTTEDSEASGSEPMDIAQKVLLLRKVNLFAALPGDVLVTIAESCEPRELAAEQLIFAEGDAPDGLYIIVSGQVKIRKGKRTLVSLVASEFFGEVALLDDDPRMADAVAVSDGLALFMDREVFRRIAEDLPDVLRAVTRTLIQYLKHAEAASGNQTLF